LVSWYAIGYETEGERLTVGRRVSLEVGRRVEELRETFSRLIQEELFWCLEWNPDV
jgi:hypothetical protein